jgi:hypothetical protein
MLRLLQIRRVASQKKRFHPVVSSSPRFVCLPESEAFGPSAHFYVIMPLYDTSEQLPKTVAHFMIFGKS